MLNAMSFYVAVNKSNTDLLKKHSTREFEVSINALHFHKGAENINFFRVEVREGKNTTHTFFFSRNDVPDLEHFLSQLNKNCKQYCSAEWKDNNRILLVVKPTYQVQMSKALANAMGFQYNVFTETSQSAYPVCKYSTIQSHILIACNLIEPYEFGSGFYPILGIKDIGTDSCIIVGDYHTIRFCDVASIKITFLNTATAEIAFIDGTFTIILHFRKKAPPNTAA